MNDYTSLPYRQKVIAYITNKHKELLLVQLIGYQSNQWNLPGGGIEPNENKSEALMRELYEELGTKNFTIIKQSKIVYTYEWPVEVIEKSIREKNTYFRGQQQHQFLVSFTGHDSDIKVDPGEIKTIMWCTQDKLDQFLLFPNQLENTMAVLKEFTEI
jgi:putative (di)nucleoside polyphosphate hydrolase